MKRPETPSDRESASCRWRGSDTVRSRPNEAPQPSSPRAAIVARSVLSPAPFSDDVRISSG